MAKDKDNENEVIEGELEENEEAEEETLTSVAADRPNLFVRGWRFCVRHKTVIIAGGTFVLGALAGVKIGGRSKGSPTECVETTSMAEIETTVEETEPDTNEGGTTTEE